MRARRVIIVLLASFAGVVPVAAFLELDSLRLAWWDTVGERTLNVAERESVAKCEVVAWTTLVKVIQQDVEDACPGGWFADAVAAEWHPSRAPWLTKFAEGTSFPHRARLRAALALERVGLTPPSMNVLLSDAATPMSVREGLASRLGEEPNVPGWVSPDLKDDIAIDQFRHGSIRAAPRVARRLRLASVTGVSGDKRSYLLNATLEGLGLANGRLESLQERIHNGMPLESAPIEWVFAFRKNADACAHIETPGCMRLLAVLAERSHDPDELPFDSSDTSSPPLPLVSELWAAMYSDDTTLIQTASDRFREQAAWISAETERTRRVGRLLGTVAHPNPTYGAELARVGYTGDPLLALEHGRASASATAAAALVLGDLAHLSVAVSAVDSGVILRIEDRAVGIGPCGEKLDVPPSPGEPWPLGAVLAQAATEAADGALRTGEHEKARRLAELARKLDSEHGASTGCPPPGP